MKPVFTVVTPSFNQGAYIEDTLRSVICQQGDFYIDYIVMDGGSGDRSVDIIRHFSSLLKKMDPVHSREGVVFRRDGELVNCLGASLRWVSETDRGQVHALKKGFSLALGNVLCWLNSDDIFTDHSVLSRVMDYFLKDPDLKILFGDGPFISETGLEIGVHRVRQINIRELLFLDYHILQPAAFFVKEIYSEKLLQERYVCAFDAAFFISLLKSGNKYLKVSDRFAAFRFYKEIKTVSLSKKRFFEQMRIAVTYSKNPFFLLVSVIYRYFEIVLKTGSWGQKKSFQQIFSWLRKISYRIVTGYPGRRET